MTTIENKTPRSLFAWLMVIAATSSCVPEVLEPGVEPALVSVVPVSETRGSATLSIFMHPDAAGSAAVWLHTLDSGFTTNVTTIETEAAFPVEIEPGELVRVRFDYQLAVASCDHKLSGTVYDDLAEEFTSIVSPAARLAECN